MFYAITAIKHDFLLHLHLLGPRDVFKPSPFRLQFQHLPRGPADVNAQEIMFDRYNNTYGY